MKARLKWMLLSALIAVSGLVQSSIQPLSPFANNQVTVKLVLGEQASLPGYQGVNDTNIFHRNVVTYTAASDSLLPTPTKTGTTFVSWVYAQSSALVRVNKMPKTSGATYYAYWQGDGSLATTIPSSVSSSSSTPITSSSIITSTEVISSSIESFVPFNLYLQANTANVNWTDANAQIRIFFWNAPITLDWPGIRMTSEGNGLYSYRFETFAPTNLLFVRLNPNDASDVWNQTVDLTYASGQNLFTLTAWNNGEGKSIGSWSTYQPSTSSSLTSSSSMVTSSDMMLSSSSNSLTSSVSESSSASSSFPPSSSQTQSSTIITSSSIMDSSMSSSTMITSSSSNTSEIIASSSSSSQIVSSGSTSWMSSSTTVSSETSSIASSQMNPSSSLTSSVLPIQFDVYLKVNDPLADWSQGNATFKLHYWGHNQSSDWNQLPSLTSLGNGIYHYAFLDYQPTHLLFQRRSADQTIIWNMTIDYAYPGDDALLTITSWSSLEYCGDCLDKGTKSTGVWSTYSPA
jgi:hypothetical protein